MTNSPKSGNTTVIQPNSSFKVKSSALKLASKIFGLSEISIRIIVVIVKRNRYMIKQFFRGYCCHKQTTLKFQ